MPELELVDRMEQMPGSCLLCGCVPVDETKAEKPPLPAVFAVGLDVDWGNSVYICWVCAGLIADMIDRPDRKKVEAVFRGAKLQKLRNKKLMKELTEVKDKFQKLLEAQEVVKQELDKKEAKG